MRRPRVRLARRSVRGDRNTLPILSPEELEVLLDVLDVYGPETVGFVVDIEEGFREDLPEAWTAEEVDHGDES